MALLSVNDLRFKPIRNADQNSLNAGKLPFFIFKDKTAKCTCLKFQWSALEKSPINFNARVDE